MNPNNEYKNSNQDVQERQSDDYQSYWRQLSDNLSLHKHWALFFKNWIKLRGNLTLVFWVLLLPSIELSLFLMVTGPQHGFRVSVFNDDLNGNYSTQILDLFDNTSIIQFPHRTLQSAIRSVETGETSMAITFAANFSDSLVERIESKFTDDQNDTAIFGSQSTVNLYADMSNIMVGPQIVDKVRVTVINFLKHYFQSVDENPRIAEVPLVPQYIYGRYDPTFAEYALPGLMSFILFYAPLKLCTFAMLKDREEGILERSLVAGVNVSDYIVSHIVLQFMFLILQIVVYSVTVLFIWELEVKGSILLLITEIFFHGFCSISFGVLISALVSTESAAMVVRIGVLLPSFFFSGIIWPVESYTSFLQTLTLLSPLTLPTEAFRSIMSRGWGLSHFPVWIAIVSNCIHSVIYLMIAVFTANIKIINP
ncbi:uncharacterized protein LOC128964390 [Oppia nitens]|uniref:uncharacterized protein LOC128964390 n=1 Tax=Oppia nitens TaxID=1686743 RepID=UPI0023DA35A9|nr:uncharacterized protein LOC128964390 [Oppia nitens]